MKLIVTKFVHGLPKAQPRCRATSFAGGRVGVYDPGTANGWKSLIAIALRSHAGNRITDALRVDLHFFFPRPKSHYGTGKNSEKLKPSSPAHHVIKPDNDNLEKAVYDTLSHKSGIGLWHDDSQIVENLTRKEYAEWGNAGVRITICSMEGELL